MLSNVISYFLHLFLQKEGVKNGVLKIRWSRFFCGMFLVFYAILSTVKTSECSYSNGRHYCYGAKHCCAKRKVCRDNCLGDSCNLSSDCAPGEIAVTENVLRIVPHVPIVSNAL